MKINFIIGVALMLMVSVSFSGAKNAKADSPEKTTASRIETFTFSTGGKAVKGKIFLPASYETNKNLPAIFLIDYTEQHFKIATDEFEKVIEGVNQIPEFDALVVTLEEILEIDAGPETFQDHYKVFKDMTFRTLRLAC